MKVTSEFNDRMRTSKAEIANWLSTAKEAKPKGKETPKKTTNRKTQ